MKYTITVFILFFTMLAITSQAQYDEVYRPQFHYSSKNTWLNDPNGMFYYDGEYHLFYQNNPFGTKWGHMSWGHAISKDLIHWEELPVALKEEDSVAIFSGSAVVDWKNSSELGKDGNPPIIAIYTGWHQPTGIQYQCLAYSNDKGRSWIKYAENPILDINSKNFRDPKVIWHEPTKQWVMLLVLAMERKVQFYGSKNLKNWELLSEFGPAGAVRGIWECPDLFALSVDGKENQQKWVLEVDLGSDAVAGGSGSQYFIGMFDGKNFTPDKSYQPEIIPALVPDGKIIEDFEGETYGDWLVEGDAFGNDPARGTLKDQNIVVGYKGKGLVNTFLHHDNSIGKLTSPEFVIEKEYINFLIGGGAHINKTCMNLIVSNEVVRSAAGENSENLVWKSWKVDELLGKKAKLEIIDNEKGGWGHVNVDHIMIADEPVLPDREKADWLDYGKDYYAAVSWSDIPKKDGRRIWLGWLNNWQYANEIPTNTWRGSMSIPREVKLKSFKEGIKVVQHPVEEVQKLRIEKLLEASELTVKELNKKIQSKKVRGQMLELELKIDVSKSNNCGLNFCKGKNEQTTLGFRTETGILYFDRINSGESSFSGSFAGIYNAPVSIEDNVLRLHLFIDKSVAEVFVNHGEVVLTNRIFPNKDSDLLEFFSDNPNTLIKKITVWRLKSIWNN